MNAKLPMTSLPERMRLLAKVHPRGAELVKMADEVDRTVREPDFEGYIGTWERALNLFMTCNNDSRVRV